MLGGVANARGIMASLKFTDEQLKGILVAVGEREGRGQDVDPDTEIVGMGSAA